MRCHTVSEGNFSFFLWAAVHDAWIHALQTGQYYQGGCSWFSGLAGAVCV